MIMKKVMLTLIAILGIMMAKAETPVTVGVDLYNRYVWRGIDFGNSPSIQPTLKYTIGGFSVGAWGAFATNSEFSEVDLSATYAFSFGLTLLASDYFATGDGLNSADYLDYSNDSTSFHAYELSAIYAYKGLTLTGGYFLNKSDVSDVADGDSYVEAKYTFENSLNFFVGAGNGFYTTDTDFMVCNVGVGASKTIKVTDTFSIPMNAAVMVNPDSKNIFFTVGISL